MNVVGELIEDLKTRINLKKLDVEDLSSLRFFFGGFGDARHIYASLIDFHTQALKLSSSKQKYLKFTLVVNDIKPHTFAKLLIMFSALRSLSKYNLDQIGQDYEATKAAALVMYIFVSNVMPAYLGTELDQIIENLIKSDLLNESWSFIKIDEKSKEQTLRVLRQWSSKPPISTHRMIRLFNKNDFEKCGFDPEKDFSADSVMKSDLERKKQEIIDYIEKKIPDKEKSVEMMETIKNMPLTEFLPQNKPSESNRLKNTSEEKRLTDKLKYLLPPFIIQCKNEKKFSKKLQDPNDSDHEKLTEYVYNNWKPNVTILDYDWYLSTGDGSIALGWDFVGTCFELYGGKKKSNDKSKETCNNNNHPANPQGVFDWYAFYFIKVAKALDFLTQHLNALNIIGCIGDVYDSLSNLNLELKPNMSTTKHKFDRIYVSNIPDYTSIIHVFLECMPLLKTTETSYVKSTILMNTGLWADYAHYVYSGSLLQSLKQGEKLLNVAVFDGDIYCDQVWSHAVNEFKPCFSARNEVINWLSRVLLTFAYPAKRDDNSAIRETFSPNLTVFFRSIQYLIYLGYPKHWFQSYLTSVLENNLVTNAKCPIQSPNKCLPQDFRDDNLNKVDLSTILVELQTLSSVYAPLLEIGDIELKKNLDKICEYEICFKSFSPKMLFSMNMTVFNEVLGMLFEDSMCNSTEGLRYELISKNMKKKMFSVVKLYSENKTARFWMHIDDFESMTSKNNQWFVSLIRTDSWIRVSLPEKLTNAKKLRKFL